jgi:hypothetical protein
MSVINRFKQAARELTSTSAKTELPPDVVNLMNKADRIETLYSHTVSSAEKCFPEKHDKGFHKAKIAMDGICAEYQSTYGKTPEVRFMTELRNVLGEIAKKETEMKSSVHEDFVEPKSEMISNRIQPAKKHYETLKQKRLDLDSKKHKLKGGEDAGKLKKYEVEVQNQQEKFDSEADAIREYMSSVANDEEMIANQSEQAMMMVKIMKKYFKECYEALEELESKHDTSKKENVPVSITSRSTPNLVATPLSSAKVKMGVPLPSPVSTRVPLVGATANSPALQPPINGAQKKSAPPVIPRKPTLAPPVAQKKLKCCALYDFEAEQEGDLALVTGDLIEIIDKNGEWWKGKNIRTSHTGLFPANYVKLM